MLEFKSLTRDGLRVGARYRVVQPKLRPAVYEVTECSPNQAFTWAQKFPGGAMVADHRITTNRQGTEVELSFRCQGISGNIVCRIFSKMIGEYVATEAKS